ncbi:MAG: class I SAM-dependent methyltransferase [Acidimicrobiales bacterium]
MQTNDQATNASEYGADYYASHCGEAYERSDLWLNQFGHVADRIIAALQPRKTLDVGCAHGFLVEALAKRGVDAFGIDFSEYAISQVHESVADSCRVASATEPIEDTYDLITSIEMLEHLTPGDALLAIRNMTSATDTL